MEKILAGIEKIMTIKLLFETDLSYYRCKFKDNNILYIN